MEFPELPEGWAWEVVREDYPLSTFLAGEGKSIPTVRISLLDEAGVVVRMKLMIEQKQFEGFGEMHDAGFVWDGPGSGASIFRSTVTGARCTAQTKEDLVMEADRMWKAQQEEDKRFREQRHRDAVLDSWVGVYPPKKLGEV